MKSNMSVTDRWIRVVLAALGVWLASALGFGSVGGLILLVVAGILAVTAALGFCPLYVAFGISTNRRVHRPADV